MNDVGTTRQSSAASATITTIAPSHARGRPSTLSTAPHVALGEAREAPVEDAEGPGGVRLDRLLPRSIAQSAGVSVSATSPESTTAITIVIANCRNIAPVTPPVNATGTNTATSESTIATSAPATCGSRGRRRRAPTPSRWP